jgi:predicted phage gp36 major capsid-like protein
MSFHCEHRSDAENDQNPDDEAAVPKESVDHESDSSVETAYKYCANGNQSREMERRHESDFIGYVLRFHRCTRSRRGTGKATDRWREAARSSEAERARWLQVCRDGQGDQALGGRLHGVRAESHHACRTDLEAAI